MFDLKRLTLMFFLSALATSASATLILPSSSLTWSLDKEISSIPLLLDNSKASDSDQQVKDETVSLYEYEYSESHYQLIC